MKKFLLLCMALVAFVCTANAQLAQAQRSQQAPRLIEGTKSMPTAKLSPTLFKDNATKSARVALEELALNPLEFTFVDYLTPTYVLDFAMVLTQSQISVPNEISYAQYVNPEVAARFAGNTLKNIYTYYPEGAMQVTFWIKEDLYSDKNVWELTSELDVTSGSYGEPVTVPCEYAINPNGFFFGMTVEKLAISKKHYTFFHENSRSNGSFLVDFGNSWYDFSSNGTLYFWFETEGENGLSDFDINMDYATVARVAPETEMSLPAGFTNMGAMPLTQVQLKYMLNGEEKTVDVDIVDANGQPDTLLFLDYYEFEFPETAPATAGRYPIALQPNLLNGSHADAYTQNAANTAYGFIILIANPYPRKAVMEQITGTWCGWCPRGHVAMELLKEQYPDDFIGIAVHWQDNFATEGYATLANSIGSAPYALFSRAFDADPFYGYGNGGFGAPDIVKSINGLPAEGKLGVSSTVSADGASVELAAHATFSVDDNNGSYSVAYVILEDAVGAGQTNYYYQQDMSGEPAELQDLATKGSPYRTTLNDVARGIYNCWGIEGSLPTHILNGETYCHKITVPMPENILNQDNCSVVALLIDNYSGEIINAVKEKLNEATTGIESMNNGTLAAEISVEGNAISVKAAQGTAAVYATDGKLVAKTAVNGAATLNVAKGSYIVRVENGNDVVVKKVVL